MPAHQIYECTANYKKSTHVCCVVLVITYHEMKPNIEHTAHIRGEIEAPSEFKRVIYECKPNNLQHNNVPGRANYTRARNHANACLFF